MNKSDLAGDVARKSKISKRQAGEIVDSVFASIREAMYRGESVRIAGFGTFGTRFKAARVGRDLKSGAPVGIPARMVPEFRAGAALKDGVGARGQNKREGD